VTVKAEAPAGLPALDADPDRLAEALARLVTNALEASPRGKSVTLTARPAAGGKALTLAVEDRGPGVAPEHLRDVGRPFFTTKPGGVGLGLAEARRIAQAHGGMLEVGNRPDGGCEAALTLPAKTT
ncbi:MAG: sensor histidine kinase, partial [Elusimicrobia bacterium]|nr:sensor histidine kinase [Elusimicrobiota bacterium]